MTGRYRLYPDLWRPRLRYMAVDAAVLLWIILWIRVGEIVHDAFWSLHVVADAVIATGHGVATTGQHIDRAVSGVQDAAGALSGVEVALRRLLAGALSLIAGTIDATGNSLRATGQGLTGAITSLQQGLGGVPFVGSALQHALALLIALTGTVTALGESLRLTGRNLHQVVSGLQTTVTALPAIRNGITHALDPLHAAPNALIAVGQGTIAQGQQELVVIAHLALLMGVIVAAIPICMALLRFAPWRLRSTRNFRYLDEMLRQPGGRAVTTTMQVLAGRAIYTMPYERLLSYSPDPIGEWREGRYVNLARATMATDGLDLHRYLRRQEGLSPTPSPLSLPLAITGDDESRSSAL